MRTARSPRSERVSSAGDCLGNAGRSWEPRPRPGREGGGPVPCAGRPRPGDPGPALRSQRLGSELGHEARAALPLLAAEHRMWLGAREGTCPAGARERARKKSTGPAGLLGRSRGSGTTVAPGQQQHHVDSCHQRGHQTAVPWGSGNQLKGWGTHALQ